MHVDTIDSYEAFTALEENWNDLYQNDIDAQFFLSWQWFSWVFKNHPGRWRVLAVKAGQFDNEYLGFFPFWPKTVWSETHGRFRDEIRLAGPLPWANCTGFVCHPRWQDEVIGSFAEQLKDMRWAKISLKYLRASDKRVSLFLSRFPNKMFRTSHRTRTINEGRTDILTCPYIELPDDYETYLQNQVSANTRRNLRRFMRRFESSEDLRVTETSAETLESDLDVLVALWTKKWAASKGKSTKRQARKYRKILRQGFVSGALYMLVLWRGATPIGALASFVDWQKLGLFGFIIARDETLNEPSGSWLLHAHTIRWAIDHGFRIYDLGHGDQPYKYVYGATDNPIKYVVVRTRSGANLNSLNTRHQA